MLSAINSLIVRARDRDELFQGSCRIAVELGAFSMAWIGVVDPVSLDGQVVASFGAEAGYLRKVHFTARAGTADSAKPSSRALRFSQPVICNDVANDASIASMRSDLLECGHRAVGCFPLTIAGRTQAVLALFAGAADVFDDSEMKLLTELSGDISFALDHIAKQDQLAYLAYFDELTGLPNRRRFCEQVDERIRGAASGGRELFLFLIDLERFKNINQSLGRPAGDQLLQRVAEWLQRSVGGAGFVARLGADQFAVLASSKVHDRNVVRRLERAMSAFLAHPFELNAAAYRIAARVGVAAASGDVSDAETLLIRAEAALKQAKIQGTRYLFYTPGMTAAVASKLKLETQLRMALENHEFVLHYQPKRNLSTGELTGAEALVRWSNPRAGLIAPGEFIPILEESGLIIEVGRWVLRQAVEDHRRWRDAGLGALRIAVNVSPLQLRHRDFVADITALTGGDSRLAAGLELEVTENVFMEDTRHIIAGLTMIRALGVRIAVDDFGTGFSSLSYLAKLPVDSLKIDRSFVTNMPEAPEGLVLVSAIINLAHSLGLSVVAEGVESEQQLQLLRPLNCDEVQGFLFGRPAARELFEAQYLRPEQTPEGGMG